MAQRVWLTDLDFNFHMNNAQYLAALDLGRVNWLIRSGLWSRARRRKISPIIGGTIIRFRRSLQALQPYRLHTRPLGWDDKWIYFEQVMTSTQGTACVSVQRIGFIAAGRHLRPEDILATFGIVERAPALPSWIKGWSDAEAECARNAEQNLAASAPP